MLEHGAVVVVGTVIREAALRCGGTKLIFRMDQSIIKQTRQLIMHQFVDVPRKFIFTCEAIIG